MRVYGALMWSISKVINVPECPKVFVGSFWDQQLKHDLYRKLFERELQLLFDDLQDLPKNAAIRKINDFIKRARMAKIHAYIISSLKADMPKLIGKSRKKKELIRNLPNLFKKVQEEHLVSSSDIPPVAAMQEKLALCDFSKFPTLKDRLIIAVDAMLENDVATLVSMVPQGAEAEPPITGGAFDDVKDTVSPFGYQRCEGIDLGAGEPDWIVTKERTRWDAIFRQLGPINGKITGSTAKKEMVKSRLNNPVLAKVWRLADVDGDGMLDSDEFALAMHLIHIKLDGFDLPDDLPKHLVPPSKKSVVANGGRRRKSSAAAGGGAAVSDRGRESNGNGENDGVEAAGIPSY
jgi:EH domain-containing protein 1